MAPKAKSGFGRANDSSGRAPLAIVAWVGATAIASTVAWLGVDSVLIPAAETPPAVLAAGARTTPVLTPAPPSTQVSPSPSAGLPASSAPAHGHGGTTPVASASASPTASPTSSLSRYETAGGVVVLAISAHFVSLVSATPAAGYSVQNWGATGWLRVDFSQGSTTYSVFATWNGYSPQVQVVGPSATS